MLLLVLTSLFTSAQEIISYYDGEQIYLRWQGVKDGNVSSYVIYEKSGSDWNKIGTTSRLVKNNDIKKQVGANTELYLQLAGITDINGDFTDEVYQNLVANEEAYAFFGAMCLIDAKMGKAIGELYQYKPSNSSKAEIEVQIKYIQNGTEKELVTTTINVSKPHTIPQPKMLNASMSNQSVEIQWNQLESRTASVGVYVYRSKNRLGPYTKLNPTSIQFSTNETASNAFLDRYATEGITYYYTTRYNVFGVESLPSEIVSINVKPNSLQPILNLNATEKLGLIELRWDSLSSKEGVTIYRKTTREKTFERIFPISDRISYTKNSYLDRTSQVGFQYQYYVTTDNENRLASSDTISFSLIDDQPPAPPVNVSGTVSKTGVVKLTWDANKEPDILGYLVERYTGDSGVNNFLLTGSPLPTNSFSESIGAKSESAYRYVVFAIDQSYNKSVASEPIRLRRPDDIAPKTPAIIYVDLTDSIVMLNWTPGMESDIDKYVVYRGMEDGQISRYKEVKIAGLRDTLHEIGTYTYGVSTVDYDNNESAICPVQKFNYTPEFSLSTPTNGIAIDSNGHVFLSWDLSTSKNVTGYMIERKDDKIGKQLVKIIEDNSNQYFDRYQKSSEDQTYYITAFDKQYNVSKTLVIEYRKK